MLGCFWFAPQKLNGKSGLPMDLNDLCSFPRLRSLVVWIEDLVFVWGPRFSPNQAANTFRLKIEN